MWIRTAAVVAAGALAVAGPRSQESQEPLPLADDSEESRFFATADYDGSGWISFREAESALLLDRDEFARFDLDGDGRIDAQEFGTRYRSTIDQVGGFTPPIPEAGAKAPPPRGPEQLRNTYDVDLNGSLDLDELGALIADYGIEGLPPQLAMGQLDNSGNGRLELIELEFVATLLDALRTSPTNLLPSAEARTLEELFGIPIERPAKRGQLPRPPRITGPIQPFARLDLDRDGNVTVEDLSELQFPMALPVRPATVIASLDTDGDGRLDREEFRSAMGAAPLPAPPPPAEPAGADTPADR